MPNTLKYKNVLLVIKSGCKWKYLVEKLVKKVFKITFFYRATRWNANKTKGWETKVEKI